MSLPMLKEPLLDAQKGLTHGFFTRGGGSSLGLYTSLNCGLDSGDDPANVEDNLKAVTKAMHAGYLCTLRQTHSLDVITVTNPWKLADRPEGDAMVTAMPGIALGILTADCVPVLFADPKERVIGVAHAGWKGAQGNIVSSTLAAMEQLGAFRRNIVAVIGPAIVQNSYQVDSLFHARFVESDADADPFFDRDTAAAGSYRFDLKGYVLNQLRAAGVKDAAMLPDDTYSQEHQFYSYRRATHKGETDYGRQISAIALL